jgi:YVTN family beta-propeller protein
MRLNFFLLILCSTAPAFAANSPGTLIVINQKQHAVDLVDPATGKLLTAVNVGVNGHEIVLSKDETLAYVPIYSNVGVGKTGTNGQFIDVIDLHQAKVIRSIDLGHPVRPHKPLLGPDGLLYVSAELDNAIDVVNPTTGKVIAQIPTGAPQSHVFAISPDGLHAYTANVGSGSMSVLDLKTRKLITVIPLTKTVQRAAVSNDNRWAFTSDWDNPRVAVIDTQTNTLSRWIPTTGTPYVTQPTPDGRYLLVGALQDHDAKEGPGVLNIVDLHTFTVIRTIPTNAEVISFLIHDGHAYMSCAANGAVEVLDIRNPNPATWTLGPTIQLAPGVDALAWTDAAWTDVAH